MDVVQLQKVFNEKIVRFVTRILKHFRPRKRAITRCVRPHISVSCVLVPCSVEVCMGMGIPIPMGFPWEMGVVLGY